MPFWFVENVLELVCTCKSSLNCSSDVCLISCYDGICVAVSCCVDESIGVGIVPLDYYPVVWVAGYVRVDFSVEVFSSRVRALPAEAVAEQYVSAVPVAVYFDEAHVLVVGYSGCWEGCAASACSALKRGV